MSVWKNLAGTVETSFSIAKDKIKLLTTGLTAQRSFTFPDTNGQLALDIDAAPWAVAGGTADALTVTYSPTPIMGDGKMIRVRAISANATTTPTLNVNGAGPRTIVKKGGAALAAGDIAGADHELVFVINDQFATVEYELINPATDATGGGGTNPLLVDKAQTGHGFAVGDAINVRGTCVKADADDVTLSADAIVSAVADANNFTYALPGAIITLSSLTADEYYWLSGTAGGKTTTAPTTGVSQVLGKALSTTAFLVIIGPPSYLSGTTSAEVYRYGTPITVDPYFKGAGLTLTNGNRTMTKTAVGNGDNMGRANIRIDDGAWYWEVAVLASGGNRYNMIGIIPEQAPVLWYPGQSSIGYGYYGNDGSKYGPLGGAFGATFTAGDVIGVAYNARKNMLWFAKNGTWQASGNPATDTSPAFATVYRSMYPAASIYEGSSVSQLKFNFKQTDCTYAAPTGFSYLDA